MRIRAPLLWLRKGARAFWANGRLTMKTANRRQLIIRPHIGRLAVYMLAAAFFLVLGTAIIILPLPLSTMDASSAAYDIYGTGPLEYAVLVLVGCCSILFGLGTIAALFFKAWQPILVLDGSGIIYNRHRIDITWSEVSHMQPVTEWGDQKVRWIYLYVIDPDRFSGRTMVEWDAALTEAHLVLDLNLASSRDYEQACGTMQAWIDRRSTTGPCP